LKKLYVFLFLLPFQNFAQSESNACETLFKINKLIQDEHYKPKPVDDSLSVYVFTDFLKVLDEDNRIFIEPEINNLTKYKLKIDDYILSKDCSFLDDFYATYTKAVDRYEAIITNLNKEPFALNSSETIRFSKKSFPYFKNQSELENLYRKSILFNILKDVSEISNNKDSLTSNFQKLALLSKPKIFESYQCKIAGLRLSRKEFNSKLFSVFCNYFDPHTEYFSDSEKSSFLSSVSADNLTFGVYISLNEKDEIVVEQVIPGSSAYFTDKIESGDIITKLKSLGEEYTIACSSMDKIAEIISSNKYRTADFTFKKKSGEIYTVTLSKQIMKDYENNVFSYILEKDGIKTGYIKIPSFYSTFENGKTSVSDDVVREIYKLQEDKIDGLVIDLENDGGGSMDEAVRLTGLFIDIGPIAIMNNRNQKKQTLKDTNRGTVYSGPMVVMINGFSASASEFFANAMQDYNRAIIIGNQSLGKATMQRILPLSNDKNADEFVKLTIEKFYRITGKSNQYIGIKPDVEIPLLFDKQMPREKSNPTALKNDEIPSTLKYTVLVNSNNDAIEKSKIRVAENTSMKAITALNSKIDLLYDFDIPPVELQFSKVYDEIKRINTLWKEIKVMSEIEYPLHVKQNSVDIEYQEFDNYLKASNKEKIKNIKSNIHIIEAVNIINDLKK
jgi:carboxyl-terminal processing protease